ncbi:hypothetical protein PsorP6_016505 [Peronosclerospora sorghi]|uniref:Uncharacterized protein n=1 Tax=Peronosclerospora sorghi TaxID=230839 RepID=A0ACC0VR91_9STRA|nr:hypothetical protein PsorP6_016505 [Peronosclerospora sorghi]
MTGDGVEDNDDSEEPDPKRLRLTDGYDIELAVIDVPRTYNELMASPQAYKWKEAIHDLLVGCADDTADYTQLSEHFKLKDLGHARFVLGVEIQYDRPKAKLHICQSQFIQRLIEKFGQESAFPYRNPNGFCQRLEELKDGDVVDMKRYRELIGSMLYIANGTRPDICVSICELSQHLEAPKPAHMNAAILVLRYLASTSKFGLCYSRNDTTMINPVVYVDANWGGDVNNRRSTSVVLILLCGEPVIYKSKRQRSVALSSAEAEYVALSIAAQEVLWLRHLLTELSVGRLPSTMVYVDNQAAITMAEHSGYQSRRAY